jgi:hypothetical protein
MGMDPPSSAFARPSPGLRLKSYGGLRRASADYGGQG